MKGFLSAIVTSGAVLAAAGPLGAAISIDGFTAAENDRFANNPSYVANAYDMSPVGRALSGGAGKGGHWATLISSNVVITADHYHAGTGQTLYFYPGNDPGASPVTRTITSGMQIGSTDLWLSVLDSPVTPSISVASYATETLTEANFSLSTINLQNAFLNGITPTAGGYGSDRRTSQATGRNVIEDFSEDLTLSGNTTDVLITIDNQGIDPNYVSYEAQLAGGDSGAPLFIDSGGELLLVGIAWAIGEVDIDPGPGETLRDASVFSYVGNYSAEIDAFISANAVPEPSPLLFLITGAIPLLLLRRKRG